MTLLEFLTEHAKGDRVSFHMPGHKGGRLYRRFGYDRFLGNMATVADMDITEIAGADNLHSPEGIINGLEEDYRKLYGVEKSFLLVNGSTAGVMAAMLSSAAPGKKILMSRGSHRSAYSALKLGNITPVYLQPEMYEDYGIMGKINPEDVAEALDRDKDIQAVLITSPNYYGVCSDVRAIADEVHKRGRILITDQAHGAHLKLFEGFGLNEDLSVSAETGGADIVINSIHKTLGSFTQSALLNVVSDRVNQRLLRENLNMLQSTSPSYILMASLAVNAELIKSHGKELFGQWKENLDLFYKIIKDIDGVEVISGPDTDRTKLNIKVAGGNVSGKALDEYLRSKGIDSELYTGDILMAMTGMGNERSDYEKLLSALDDAIEIATDMPCKEKRKAWKLPKPGPVKEHGNETEEIALDKCQGRVSAVTVIPYPPGIPFICPGEEFTEEILENLKLAAEESQVSGLSDKGTIHVYK